MTTTKHDTPISTHIISQPYSITGEKYNIYGMLTAPTNYREHQLPLIIISHGFNNTLEMYEDDAQKLAQQGFLVLRFDFFLGGAIDPKPVVPICYLCQY